MMTIKEVLDLVREYEAEEKKTKRVPHYYVRKGQVFERSYPDYVYTARYKELGRLLRSDEAKVFKCADCGEMVTYFDLETWMCDSEKGYYLCGMCYEESMGEDL